MGRLLRALARATTGDIQRAAMFLEWAYEVRAGCAKQRGKARKRRDASWQ
jgi:hypothetical protein